MQDAWEYLTKLPDLIETWGTYSWALLVALALVGAGLILVFTRRGAKRWSVEVVTGVLVVLLAAGGVALKVMGAAGQRRAQQQWIAHNQARAGEHRVVVSNFFPLGADPGAGNAAAVHEFVSLLSGIVGEDLPSSIPPPAIVYVDFLEKPSPWRAGIDQANFGDVLQRLGVLEIVWGDLDATRGVARTFLGILPDATAQVDPWIPLRELPVRAAPGPITMGDGYDRLLGHVALGVALQTLRDARAATGEERKRLLLLGSQQILEAQRKLVNAKEDPVLKRNLYERGSHLVADSLAEAGVAQ